MALSDEINEKIKDAMRSKDQVRLEALRSIKSALLLAEREKGAGGKTSEDAEMKILQKQVKQRKEAAEVFQEQGRDELAENELKQAEIIEEFLPKQLSREELEPVIEKIISETGAESMQDMGKVMGRATQELAGKADNKMISEIVREKLN